MTRARAGMRWIMVDMFFIRIRGSCAWIAVAAHVSFGLVRLSCKTGRQAFACTRRAAIRLENVA